MRNTPEYRRRGGRVVVVVHQSVVVIPVYRISSITKRASWRAARTMLEFLAYFNRGHLQRAIEAEGLGSRRTLSVIGAIPLRWRIGISRARFKICRSAWVTGGLTLESWRRQIGS